MFRVAPSLARGLRSTALGAPRAFPPRRAPPTPPALRRVPFSSTRIDREAGKDRGQEKITGDPSKVSTKSSTRTLSEDGDGQPSANNSLKNDIHTVQETFRLDTIPRSSHILGLAGTVPYFVTSLTTLYLGWDLSKQWPTGNSLYDAIIINHDTAQHLLSILEPVQLGYGALIISSLGAVHWGLEYAEKTTLRERTQFRYAMGVAAPILAWPTLLMPVEYGLTAQFMTFVGLYFADARAATRGWAPPWYAHYRFLLTLMVGLGLFVSLIGRSLIENSNRLNAEGLRSSMRRPGIADTETDWVKVEAEDKKKMEEEARKKEEERKEEEERKDRTEDGKEKKSDGKDSETGKDKPKE